MAQDTVTKYQRKTSKKLDILNTRVGSQHSKVAALESARKKKKSLHVASDRSFSTMIHLRALDETVSIEVMATVSVKTNQELVRVLICPNLPRLVALGARATTLFLTSLPV